jgi:hypothetical protein
MVTSKLEETPVREQHTSKKSDDDSVSFGNGMSIHDSHRITAWLMELCRVNLWPLCPWEWTLQEVIDQLAQIKEVDIMRDFGYGHMPNSSTLLPSRSIACLSCETSMAEHARFVMILIEVDARGLCLDCARPCTSEMKNCDGKGTGKYHMAYTHGLSL